MWKDVVIQFDVTSTTPHSIDCMMKYHTTIYLLSMFPKEIQGCTDQMDDGPVQDQCPRCPIGPVF